MELCTRRARRQGKKGIDPRCHLVRLRQPAVNSAQDKFGVAGGYRVGRFRDGFSAGRGILRGPAQSHERSGGHLQAELRTAHARDKIYNFLR